MPGKITKKDIEILSFIAEYKFLIVKQLSVLTQRTTQVVRRRLRHLRDNHLIVMKERGFGAGRGQPENIIILTQKGMELLQDLKILSDHGTYITDKTMKSRFINHDLLANWLVTPI